MIFTLVLIGFISSFVLIYTQELARLYHKLIVIPGVKLLVPLLFASWLIETNELWGGSLLFHTQGMLHHMIQNTARFLPFERGVVQVLCITFLFSLACFPVLFAWIKIKRRGLFELPPSSYYFGAVLWVIAVFLFIV